MPVRYLGMASGAWQRKPDRHRAGHRLVFESVQLTLNELEILPNPLHRAGAVKRLPGPRRFLELPACPSRQREGPRRLPVWFDSMPVFAILVRIAETFAIPGLDEKSEAFQAIEFRDALDSLKPAIDRVALAHGWRTTTDLRGADLIQSLLADLDSLLG